MCASSAMARIAAAVATKRDPSLKLRESCRFFCRRSLSPLAAAAAALVLSSSSLSPSLLLGGRAFSCPFSGSSPAFVRRSPPGLLLTSRKTSTVTFPVLLRGGGGDTTTKRTTAAAAVSSSLTTQLRSTTAATAEPKQLGTSDDGHIRSAMTPSERLTKLRARMAELDLDVYVVPSDDPHLSEYVADAYKRRAFLTGFQGSAGTALVTSREALLWTDSRYWNEASLQLDPDLWTLQKSGLPATPTIPKFLGDLAAAHYQDHSGKPLRVGMDPFVNAASFAKEVEDAFKEAAANEVPPPPGATTNGASAASEVVVGVLDTSSPNLVDEIWGDERPDVPFSPFRVHPLEYAGASVEDKVAKVRKQMQEKKVTLAVFTTLDDVAYLLNVRSKGDVDTCPVGIAYAAVTMDEVRLYCDPRKITDDVRKHLSDLVQLLPYDAVVDDVKAHCEAAPPGQLHKVWMDKSRTNYGLISLVPERMLVDAKTAVTDMKAVKNEAEMKGMRQAHLVDGAAMATFMAWLEHEVVEVGRKVSEVEVDEVLTGHRADQPGFVEVSFPTIAGVGPNGAIIHYRAADNEIMKYVDRSSPLLLDSGGQYTYGTTDVTRSWHFGTPTPEYMDAYTRVLKGNIGMDEVIYPEGTPGFALDIYARRWLWESQKDYGHGTGHGVGAALNVHEGPMSISPRWLNKEGLKAGMVVSNEPGYYEDGNFGIRIENLLEIQYVNPEDAIENHEGEGEAKPSSKKKFLLFKKLTMIPIQLNLIDLSLMTSRELDWIDAYHEEVFEKVSPLLEPGSPALAWLTKSCAKINRP